MNFQTWEITFVGFENWTDWVFDFFRGLKSPWGNPLSPSAKKVASSIDHF